MDGGRRRDQHRPHPFVKVGCRLSVRTLETGQPERYLWIDEGGIASRVGPPRPNRDRSVNTTSGFRRPQGWTVLDACAQQLVAQVFLLVNLTERVGPRGRDKKLHNTGRDYLPPCLTEDWSLLQPNPPLGMAGDSAPGSGFRATRKFGLRPYPPERCAIPPAGAKSRSATGSSGFSLSGSSAPGRHLGKGCQPHGSGSSGEHSHNRYRVPRSTDMRRLPVRQIRHGPLPAQGSGGRWTGSGVSWLRG